jgi:pimeloyl-ACP methyl ester carboxylesterase
LQWVYQMQKFSLQNRVIGLDMRGHGLSDKPSSGYDMSTMISDIKIALDTLRVTEPVVLVGHSFGGYNAQIFASRYSDKIVGLVLVDASHPDQVERFLQPPLRINTAPSARLGVAAFADIRLPLRVPPEVRGMAMGFLRTQRTRHAIANEYISFRESAAQVKNAGPLPAVPLVVLTRGLGAAAANPLSGRIEELWQTLQAELAERSPFSAHVVARRSGHHIHLDQAQLVADAVALVVDTARQSNRSGRADSHSPRHPSPHWLAFKDAEWRRDTLHSEPRCDPALRGRLAQNGFLPMGRIAMPIDAPLPSID